MKTAVRRKWGAVLIALGILGILWGVFHVLGTVSELQARQPGVRVGYDQTKVELHRVYFGALVRSLTGLAVALLGGRLLRGS